MRKWLFFFFLCPMWNCFAESFSDPLSGISFEIPQNFRLTEWETDEISEGWWYVFTDDMERIITLEIETYDPHAVIPEKYHRIIGEDQEQDAMVYEGLEFVDFNVNELEITKCRLKILPLSKNVQSEPLYLCDYLFVKDPYGFCFNFVAKDEENQFDLEYEAMMLTLLKSIKFSK